MVARYLEPVSVSAKPKLRLVERTEPAPELPPAADDIREPYVADWMIAEGRRHLRDARAARRYRQAIVLIIAASVVSAAWTLWTIA